MNITRLVIIKKTKQNPTVFPCTPHCLLPSAVLFHRLSFMTALSDASFRETTAVAVKARWKWKF